MQGLANEFSLLPIQFKKYQSPFCQVGPSTDWNLTNVQGQQDCSLKILTVLWMNLYFYQLRPVHRPSTNHTFCGTEKCGYLQSPHSSARFARWQWQGSARYFCSGGGQMFVYSDDSTHIKTFSACIDWKMSGMLDAAQIVRKRKKSSNIVLNATALFLCGVCGHKVWWSYILSQSLNMSNLTSNIRKYITT